MNVTNTAIEADPVAITKRSFSEVEESNIWLEVIRRNPENAECSLRLP